MQQNIWGPVADDDWLDEDGEETQAEPVSTTDPPSAVTPSGVMHDAATTQPVTERAPLQPPFDDAPRDPATNRKRRRDYGRPRGQIAKTIDIDQRLMNTLTVAGPMSKQRIAAQLQVSPLRAYLSLNRLRAQGKTEVVRDPNNAWVWQRVIHQDTNSHGA